jgi:hypothetical protein
MSPSVKELVAEILTEALNDPENASAELPNKLKGLTNIWSQKMRSCLVKFLTATLPKLSPN